jgi:hypothetical protein
MGLIEGIDLYSRRKKSNGLPVAGLSRWITLGA